MFHRVYGKDRFTFTVRVWLLCEGEYEIEVQFYSKVLVISIVTVRCQVHRPGLRLGSGVS